MAIKAGFIGLGNIGLPMAKRLVAAGLTTTVYDVVAGRDAQVDGARGAASPREVAAASDVIGLCVRDDADVRAAMLGDAGLLAGAAIFGIGWGLAGFCPGPALVGVAAGLTDAWIFLPAMLAGSWIAGRVAAR